MQEFQSCVNLIIVVVAKCKLWFNWAGGLWTFISYMSLSSELLCNCLCIFRSISILSPHHYFSERPYLYCGSIVMSVNIYVTACVFSGPYLYRLSIVISVNVHIYIVSPSLFHRTSISILSLHRYFSEHPYLYCLSIVISVNIHIYIVSPSLFQWKSISILSLHRYFSENPYLYCLSIIISVNISSLHRYFSELLCNCFCIFRFSNVLYICSI